MKKYTLKVVSIQKKYVNVVYHFKGVWPHGMNQKYVNDDSLVYGPME